MLRRNILTCLLLTQVFLTGYCAGGLRESAKFASRKQAKSLLLTEDSFTDAWSWFDIDSRMGERRSAKEDLLYYIGQQALEWTDQEKAKIKNVLKSLDERIRQQKLALSFPSVIYFVKTTGKEEGGASAYTRSNYIVLQASSISSIHEEDMQRLIAHELFHVLTRNNPRFRKDMYKIIGFQMMDPIGYPAILKNRRITNPDAPQTDSYIKLKVKDESISCMMVLYARRDYEGGSLFEYLETGFLLLNPDTKKADIRNGQPVIYSLSEVSGFFEQVGRNTGYIIHPEEIMADNFAYAVMGERGLRDQWIVNQILSTLKE